MLPPANSLALVWDADVADDRILNAQKLKILLQMLLHTDDVVQKQLQPTTSLPNSKVYRQV